MAKIIEQPTLVEAAGQPTKTIQEFVGRVNSGTPGVSIARMKSPSGWSEPGQTLEFDEYTVVLSGVLHVQLKDQDFDIAAGQAISIRSGEWVRYSTPNPEGAEYIAVCLPAFSLELAHATRIVSMTIEGSGRIRLPTLPRSSAFLTAPNGRDKNG